MPGPWEDDLRAGLHTKRVGQAFRHRRICGSTNDEMARWAEQGAPDGAVVAADEQTAGRGRLGRVWHSPPGSSLYVSLLLRPRVSPAALPPLTLLTGAVLANVLADLGVPCRLKWPNDVMLPTGQGLKKAGGILTEMATSQGQIRHVVVGIGLNVLPIVFPADLANVATSLGNVSGTPPDRLWVLQRFLNLFEPAYDAFLREGASYALGAWRPHAWLGQLCRVEREPEAILGRAVDVEDTGALVLEDSEGKRHVILSGEVITKL